MRKLLWISIRNKIENRVNIDWYVVSLEAGRLCTANVTVLGLLATGHLIGTDLSAYFNESRSCPADGNNTPATTYMRDMGGCDLTILLGYNPD